MIIYEAHMLYASAVLQSFPGYIYSYLRIPEVILFSGRIFFFRDRWDVGSISGGGSQIKVTFKQKKI